MKTPENDDDERSKEEILASIKRGFQQALRGEGRPALEVLDEIEREEDPKTFQNGHLQDFDNE
jgi:hypothetical protein